MMYKNANIFKSECSEPKCVECGQNQRAFVHRVDINIRGMKFHRFIPVHKHSYIFANSYLAVAGYTLKTVRNYMFTCKICGDVQTTEAEYFWTGGKEIPKLRNFSWTGTKLRNEKPDVFVYSTEDRNNPNFVVYPNGSVTEIAEGQKSNNSDNPGIERYSHMRLDD